MADIPGAVEPQPDAVAAGSSGARSEPPAKHIVDGGARLQLGPDGQRFYSISCSCGWESGDCGTAVLAEAHGEQHATFARGRAHRRSR